MKSLLQKFSSIIAVLLLLLYSTSVFAQRGVGINTTSPKSILEVNGSIGFKVDSITTSTTLDSTYCVVICRNASAITVTLPTISSTKGRVYVIKRAAAGSVQVNPNGSNSIDGSSSFTLSATGDMVQLISDGTSKWVIESAGAANANTGFWKSTGNASTSASTNYIGTSDGVDFVTKTSGTERMRVLSTGNIGIGTTLPSALLDINGTLRVRSISSGATTDSISTLDANGNIRRRTVANVLAASTNTLSNPTNTITSVVNGVTATATAVNTVSNTSATNSLSTTVNGVAGTSVNIINTNTSSLSGASLTNTVNGVATTALDLTPAIVSKAWSLTGNSGTSYATSFIGTTDNKSLRMRTNGTERMIVDSTGNVGIGTNAPKTRLHIVNTASQLRLGYDATNYTLFTTLSNGDFQISPTNNKSSFIGKLTTTNELGIGTSTITSGLLADFSGGNIGLTNTTNTAGEMRFYEASGSGSNYSSFKAGAQTSTINYILPLTVGSAGQQLSTDGAGNLSWTNQTGTTTNTLSLATNTLTSTVNGIAATASTVSSVSNTSAANNLSTTVNGVNGSTVTIINSNALSLASGSLTSTINGFASSALNLTSLDSSIYKTDGTLRGVRTVTMNANNLSFNSTNGNFIFNPSGTGKLGIGTSSPSYFLSLSGQAARTIGMERHTTAATAGNNLTLLAGGAVSGGTNLAGGNLMLSAGTSTGTGTSQIQLQTASAGSTGTTDNTPTTKMTILGNGMVGIGTTTPTAPLHIVYSNSGSANAVLQNTSSSGYSSFDFYSSAGNLSSTFGYANSGTGGIFSGRAYFNSYNNDFLWTSDGSTYNIFVQGSSGNVGVNTNTPTADFQANGTFALSTGNSTANSVVLISSGTFTPPTASSSSGMVYIIRHTGTSGSITVSSIIDFNTTTAANYSLSSSTGSIMIISNGTNWYRIK